MLRDLSKQERETIHRFGFQLQDIMMRELVKAIPSMTMEEAGNILWSLNDLLIGHARFSDLDVGTIEKWERELSQYRFERFWQEIEEIDSIAYG